MEEAKNESNTPSLPLQPINKHIQIVEEVSKEEYVATIKALLTSDSTNSEIGEITLHGKGERIKKTVNIGLQIRNIFKDLHMITQLHTIEDENLPEIITQNTSGIPGISIILAFGGLDTMHVGYQSPVNPLEVNLSNNTNITMNNNAFGNSRDEMIAMAKLAKETDLRGEYENAFQYYINTLQKLMTLIKCIYNIYTIY